MFVYKTKELLWSAPGAGVKFTFQRLPCFLVFTIELNTRIRIHHIVTTYITVIVRLEYYFAGRDPAAGLAIFAEHRYFAFLMLLGCRKVL